jgi:outer membrane immunogenic protein
MKRLLLASAFVVAGLLSGLPALAADLPPYSPAPYYAPAPIFTWTGVYVGASAAYNFGGFTHDGSPYFGNSDGGLFGVQAGYNYQSGPLVAGIEGDINFGSVSGSGHPYFNSYANGNINGQGSIRARFGYAFNHAMVYITGGYTGANLKGTITDFSVSPNVYANDSTFLNGWTIGAGVEYAITQHISVKAEYLYSDYGTGSLFTGTPDYARPGLNLSTLRAGVNYHF